MVRASAGAGIQFWRLRPPLHQKPFRGASGRPGECQSQEQSELPDTSFDEIPSFAGFIHQGEKPALLEKARDFIKRRFAGVDFGKLGPVGFSKKSGNEKTLVSFGSKAGETEIFKKDDSGLLKKFTDKFKTSLGPEAEALVAEDNAEIREARQRLREAEKPKNEPEGLSAQREKAAQEVEDLRTRLEQVKAQINVLQDRAGSNLESKTELQRLQQLKKELSNRPGKPKKTDFGSSETGEKP